MSRDTNSQMEKLKLLFKMQNKKELAKEVKQMAKQINQRFYRLEKQDLQNDSYAYQLSKKETGKTKPRYTQSLNKLEDKPLDTLYQESMDIFSKLFSKTSKIRGVKEIQEKRINKGIENLEFSAGIKIDKNDFKEFLELGGGEFLNSKYFDSTQIIEDFVDATKDGNISIKEFLREFKRFKKIQQRTYPRIKKNLTNLLSRKKKRKSRKKKYK